MMQFPDTLPLGIQGSIDPIRIMLIILEVAFITFGMHLAFLFFKNYRAMNDTARGSRMYAAWGWLFFSFSIMRVLILIADFYMLELFLRDIYLSFAYLVSATGALIFTYNIEGVGVIKSRHVLTITFLILYVVLIISVILFGIVHSISFVFIGNFATLFWAPVIILLSIYLIKVYKLVRGRLRIYSILMFAGIIVMILGYFGMTDLSIRFLGGLTTRFIADIGSIVGIGTVALFFMMLPSWRELDWRLALESLFIVRKGGICIYEHDFVKNSGENDSTSSMMFANALEMIKMMLQETTTGALKVLDFQDKKLLIEQGEKVMIVMIANMETASLRFLLHLFLTRFESFYHDTLTKWHGDTTGFESAKGLVQEIFG